MQRPLKSDPEYAEIVLTAEPRGKQPVLLYRSTLQDRRLHRYTDSF